MESLDGRAVARSLPTVTCYVVVYNCERYLGRALDSALAQDYPAELLDIVVVDDGSTDGTPGVLEEYRRRHPDRITVVRQANAGLVQATNTAVAAARGELLAGLDADDLWPPDKTRRQVERLMADPSLGLVYCDTAIIDPYDAVIHSSYWERYNILPQRGRDCYAKIMGDYGNVAFNITMMFRAEVARRFFPIPVGVPYQDWWITGHIASVAGIDYIEDLKAGYRTHGDNATMGATGLHEVRETCKCAEMRRQMLIHRGGEGLSESELLTAWRAWETVGRVAVTQAASAYVPLFGVSGEERDRAALHTARGRAAVQGGEIRTAWREWVRALACDPHDPVARQWVQELAWVGDEDAVVMLDSDPLAEARGLTTLAYVEELVAEPQILAAYASAFSEHDDATLVVAALGLSSEWAVGAVSEAAQRVGLDLASLPDVLLVTSRGPHVRIELERRVAALLTRRRSGLLAPAVRPEGIDALRAMLDRQRLPAAA